MGFNTAVLVINDGFSELQEHPEEFVQGLLDNFYDGGSFGVGSHANPVEVAKSEHADTVQIIAVGGNYLSVLHTTHFGARGHHDTEGQIELLKRWALSLGYNISKRPT